MSRSKKLKDSLKAAQRRRNRRAASNADSKVTSVKTPLGGDLQRDNDPVAAHEEVDIAGLMIESILAVVDRLPELKDSAAIGALRALAEETRPQSRYTLQVYEEISRRLDQRQVDDRNRRRAAVNLIKVLSTNLDSNVPDQLIRYLGVIV